MRRVGDHAVLWDLPDNGYVHAVARVVRDRFGDQLVEVVPGHQTLLLVWDEGLEDPLALLSNLKALAGDASAFKLDKRAEGTAQPELVTVPVTYDGADLEAAATSLGITRDDVV